MPNNPTLADAIRAVNNYADSDRRMDHFEPELQLILAAARCHACDCGGTGEDKDREFCIGAGFAQCPKCKADRALLAEHG